MRKRLAHGAGHGQTDVCVNIDFAHTRANAALNFFHRHAIGFLDVAAELADDGQPFLRHAARTVHHQVRVRHRLVDSHDLFHGQNVARGFAGEFVGAVAGTDGNRQGINAGALDKIFGLNRVCQQHVVGQFAHCAYAVFLTGFTGFQ